MSFDCKSNPYAVKIGGSTPSLPTIFDCNSCKDCLEVMNSGIPTSESTERITCIRTVAAGFTGFSPDRGPDD